jgi:hypothetical protein
MGIAMRIPAGKGTIHRPTDYEKFDNNFEKIFGKNRKKRIIEDARLEEAHDDYEDDYAEPHTGTEKRPE